MKSRLNKKARLSRADWLANAMDVLAQEGSAKLTIDNMCSALGVTKGSFYSHFADRADFITQLMLYWEEKFTRAVADRIAELPEQRPEDRLLALMRLLHRERVARYDVVVRAWAAQEQRVARGINKVDRQRYEFVREIFYDIGFRGAELDLRSRLFVVYHSTEKAMRLPPSPVDAEAEIKLRHAFFTRT